MIAIMLGSVEGIYGGDNGGYMAANARGIWRGTDTYRPDDGNEHMRNGEWTSKAGTPANGYGETNEEDEKP